MLGGVGLVESRCSCRACLLNFGQFCRPLASAISELAEMFKLMWRSSLVLRNCNCPYILKLQILSSQPCQHPVVTIVVEIRKFYSPQVGMHPR